MDKARQLSTAITTKAVLVVVTLNSSLKAGELYTFGNGNGTFTNVTKASGMYQPKGLNLAVGASDYDEDGWPDLFVADDGTGAYLYHTNHNGKFTNVAMPTEPTRHVLSFG